MTIIPNQIPGEFIAPIVTVLNIVLEKFRVHLYINSIFSHKVLIFIVTLCSHLWLWSILQTSIARL